VPPNIFAEDQLLIRPPKRRGMDRAGLHIQLLPGWHRGHRLCNALPAHLQIAAYERYRAIGFGQTFETAHTASSRSDKTAAPRRESIGLGAGQPHAQHDPVGNTDYGQFGYFRGLGDNPLGVSEAERKILEIVRGRHQDSMGHTVIAEGDRHFFGKGAFS
jgi:hypothetical protein